MKKKGSLNIQHLNHLSENEMLPLPTPAPQPSRPPPRTSLCIPASLLLMAPHDLRACMPSITSLNTYVFLNKSGSGRGVIYTWPLPSTPSISGT